MFDSLHDKEHLGSALEKRNRLKNNIGVVLCTIQKDGTYNHHEEQIQLAKDLNSPSIQFDFRERTMNEIGSFATNIIEYRNENLHTSISIHGDTPELDETNLQIKNHDRVREELRFLQDISGESYTIHPPNITSQIFKSIPKEVQTKIVENYTRVFTDAIKEAITHNNKFHINIENMPHGASGDLFGQSADEILLLLKSVREDLHLHGIDTEMAHAYTGVALDINHVLHDVETIDYRVVLRRWFRALGENVKVVYINTPTNLVESFINRYNLTLELSARYCPRARIMLKSRKDSETTLAIFERVKHLDDEPN